MPLTYNKPSWMTWEDKGGSLFGDKDAQEALHRGVDPTKVADAMRASDAIGAGQAGYGGRADSTHSSAAILSAFESAKGGTLDSSLGQSDYTGSVDMNIFAHGQAAAGKSLGQIGQGIVGQGSFNPLYASSPSNQLGKEVGHWTGLANTQTAADTAAANKAADDQWRLDEAAKTKKYYEDMIKAQREAAAAAAEKQRIENLKVKNTTPSAVGLGHQQLGITAARSGAFRSGAASRGTAQLARTGKGTNVKTLNIA